jgi:hypothetical protein
VLPLLYLHGLSGGDFVPALEQFLGSSAGLSASTVTRLSEQRQAEQKQFAQRDLSGPRRPASGVMYVTQVLSGFLDLAFGVLTAPGSSNLWTVYVLAGRLGFVNVFDNPARSSAGSVRVSGRGERYLPVVSRRWPARLTRPAATGSPPAHRRAGRSDDRPDR